MKACSDTHDLLLLDVTPLDIGVEDAHGNMCTIIRRNITIPHRSSKIPVFTNAFAYQTSVHIRIFEGQHKKTKYNVGEVFLIDPKQEKNVSVRILELDR